MERKSLANFLEDTEGGQAGTLSPVKRSLNVDFSLFDDTQPKNKDLFDTYEPEGVPGGDSDTIENQNHETEMFPERESPEPEMIFFPVPQSPECQDEPENQPEKKIKEPKTEAQIMTHRRNSSDWHSK